MANKTYIVELTSQERNQLKRLINTGKTAAYKQRHARILLLADRYPEGPALKDEDVANAVGSGTNLKPWWVAPGHSRHPLDSAKRAEASF